MSTKLTEERVREILSDAIQPDESLHDTHWYINWEQGDKEVTLDLACTVEELKAIVWWMEHKGKDQ